jgi:hypothetical protein
VSRALLVVVALLAAGCMGDDGDGEDGAAESLRAFLVAASESDVAGMRERLSSGSRLGAADVRERVPQGVEVPAAEEFLVLTEGGRTVAATDLDTPFGAYAAVLRREGGAWKVELPRSNLRLVEGPPAPKSAPGPDQRVGFAVYSAEPDLAASLWIDGEPQTLAGAGGPQFTRYWSTPELAPGGHLAVAMARAGTQAGAVAWTFSLGQAG